MPWTQLSADERWKICHWHLAGWSDAQIARSLGRHRATVGRELARNRGSRAFNDLGCMKGYFPHDAQQKAKARRVVANAQRARLAANPLGDYVRQGLIRFWSPQQISGRLKLDHASDTTMRISPEAIYQWVYRQARLGATWHRQLRRGRRRRKPQIPQRNKRKTHFPGAVRIDQRPAVVEARSRLGDWESDTVVGSRPGRAALATHVERKSRYVVIRKLKDRRAVTFTRATVQALAPLPAAHRLTLTVDNGSEFARFTTLEKRLKLNVYFAEPYKAWQRGANENTNGLIRQFFPKGVDLRPVPVREVAKVQDLLNNRPRKCLNYRTPVEVFAHAPPVALRN
ncbi:IS30 family transposase [Phycisphaerales bacterium AB-hyl4]|uniref:IS30 family transposase n=1 Tax=Natronomicrosphaera hydrolytica TaxID=3242702 RepID=A0ABV4U7R0_9BACT